MAKRNPEFQVFPTLNGDFAVRLVGRNGEPMIAAEGHPTVAKAKRAIRSIVAAAAKATVVVLSTEEEARRRVGLPRQ